MSYSLKRNRRLPPLGIVIGLVIVFTFVISLTIPAW